MKEYLYQYLKLTDVLGKRNSILIFVDADPVAIDFARKNGNQCKHIDIVDYFKLTGELENE